VTAVDCCAEEVSLLTFVGSFVPKSPNKRTQTMRHVTAVLEFEENGELSSNALCECIIRAVFGVSIESSEMAREPSESACWKSPKGVSSVMVVMSDCGGGISLNVVI